MYMSSKLKSNLTCDEYLNYISDELESYFGEKEGFLKRKITSASTLELLSNWIRQIPRLLTVFLLLLILTAVIKVNYVPQNVFLDIVAVGLIFLCILAILVYEVLLILKEISTYPRTLRRIKTEALKKIELGQSILFGTADVSVSKKFTINLYIKEFKSEIYYVRSNLKTINCYLFLLTAILFLVIAFTLTEPLQLVDQFSKEVNSIFNNSSNIYETIGLLLKSASILFAPLWAVTLLLRPWLQSVALKQIDRHNECIDFLESLLLYVN